MKITIDRSVVEQALEFIRAMNQHGWMLADYEDDAKRVVEDLAAALADPQGDQQPAGIVIGFNGEGHAIVEHDGFTLEEGSVLYLAPPHKTQPEPVQETIKRSRDWNDGVIEGHLREREYWLAKQVQLREHCLWARNGNEPCPHVQQAEPVQEPQRKPLSKEEIRAIMRSLEWNEGSPSDLLFARAIEAAHGIKGEA